MGKRIIALIAVMLCAVNCWGMLPGFHKIPASGETASNVTFYLNCDSATTGQTPTVGTGTVTIGASVTAVTGQVSGGLHSTAGNSAGRIVIPASSNINQAVGTIGMYINPGQPANQH